MFQRALDRSGAEPESTWTNEDGVTVENYLPDSINRNDDIRLAVKDGKLWDENRNPVSEQGYVNFVNSVNVERRDDGMHIYFEFLNDAEDTFYYADIEDILTIDDFKMWLKA